MPSKYVYKNRGKTQNYTPESLEKAVNAVQKGEMSIRNAATSFNVPRSTIGDRISGKHELHVPNGRPPHIPREIEDKIVDAVKMAARRGIGLTRQQVLNRTTVLCSRLQVRGGHTNFRAGKDWWEGVKRRHPDIALKKPEKLNTARARMVNREVIGRYFKDLGTIIEGLNLLDKPERLWNCDEMAKNFEHDPVRVVAERGSSCVGRTSSKSTNITVMACVNASGQRMPPMFVVKGKTSRSLHGFNTTGGPDNARWTFQKNGWMSDEIGEKWFNDVFLKFCGPERPQFLVLDSHSSHETLAILMRAMEEGIHILALPPHTTHLLQPLDKAVFGSLNKKYNEVCSEFIQVNPLHQINKWSFPSLFCKAWDNSVTPSNIKSGFKACGIFPLNDQVVSDKCFGPSEPTNLKSTDHSPSSTESVHDVPRGLSSVESVRDESVHDVPLSSAESVRDVSSHTDDINDASFSTSDETRDDFTHRNSDISQSQARNQPSETRTSDDGFQSVIDISDANQLMELLSGGEFVVEQILDENSNEIVVDPLIPVAAPEIEKCISETFLPKGISEPIIRKAKKSVSTSHRLLTSAEVIQEKLTAHNIKVEKENKRKNRQEKNIAKRLKKEKC